jgi:hypothetical protein
MAASGEIVARLRAVISVDSTAMKRGLIQANGEFDRTAAKQKALHASSLVAASGIGVLVGGLGLSVKAAVDAQRNTDLLAQALKHAGLNSASTAAAMDKAAAAQTKFGVSANDAKGYLATFVTATGSSGKAIKELALAEDIAAAKGISLGDAVSTVTRLNAGSTRIMTASGLVYQKSTTAVNALTAKYKALGLTTSNMTPEQTKLYNAQKMAAQITDKQRNATELLRIGFNKYGGDAAKASTTLEGKWATLHATAQNLEVTVGNKLLPDLVRLTNWISSHEGVVKALAIGLGGVWAACTALTAATKAMVVWEQAAAIKTALFGGAAATATPEVTALGAASGEAGLAGSLAILGPVAIAAGVGLAAYYHSTQPNLHLSKQFSAAQAEVNAKLSAGTNTVGGWNQTLRQATKVGGEFQTGMEKIKASGIDTGEAIGKEKQNVSAFADQMRRAAIETGHAANANAKTNPTLAYGYQQAHDYATAAAELARNLGRIPSRTQISIVAQLIEQGFTGGPSAHSHHADGGYVAGNPSIGDRVQAFLTPGELVLNKGQQSKVSSLLGADVGRVLGFASGGRVPAAPAARGGDTYVTVNQNMAPVSNPGVHMRQAKFAALAAFN